MKHFNIIILGISLMLSTGAFSKNKGRGKWKAIVKELNLTEKQTTEIKEIRKSRRTLTKDAKSAVKVAKTNFHDGLSGDLNDDELRQRFINLETAKSKLHLEKFETMLKIRKILDAEQKKKFLELRKKGRHESRAPDSSFE